MLFEQRTHLQLILRNRGGTTELRFALLFEVEIMCSVLKDRGCKTVGNPMGAGETGERQTSCVRRRSTPPGSVTDDNNNAACCLHGYAAGYGV